MSRGEELGASAHPLSEAYDAALLDLDGVLYLGEQAVPHAAESVRTALRAGMRPAYVTNNASRSPEVVAEHLRRLGVPAEPGDVVTSGQAAARYLAESLAPGSAVLVVGSDALADLVAQAGLRPVRRADDGPVAVVQGLSQQTGWADLAEAAVALGAGALWVAGNTDSTLPSPRGPLPGNGAMVAALRTTTGREPVVVGKPEPQLHRDSVERVGATRPLVVGDRLDTDVLGAVRGGADSLLVLTGVVELPALLAAPRGGRPTYVSLDLRGLLRPHLPVHVDGTTARCGNALVTQADLEGVLRAGRAGTSGAAGRPADVPGAAGGDPGVRPGQPRPGQPRAEQSGHDQLRDDVLRAACALSWALRDRGGGDAPR